MNKTKNSGAKITIIGMALFVITTVWAGFDDLEVYHRAGQTNGNSERYWGYDTAENRWVMYQYDGAGTDPYVGTYFYDETNMDGNFQWNITTGQWEAF